MQGLYKVFIYHLRDVICSNIYQAFLHVDMKSIHTSVTKLTLDIYDNDSNNENHTHTVPIHYYQQLLADRKRETSTNQGTHISKNVVTRPFVSTDNNFNSNVMPFPYTNKYVQQNKLKFLYICEVLNVLNLTTQNSPRLSTCLIDF